MVINCKQKKILKAVGIIITIVSSIILVEIISETGYWYRRELRDRTSLLKENQEQAACVMNAITAYSQFHRNVPSSLCELQNDEIALKTWCLLIKDIWGVPIHYYVKNSESNTVVKIWSYGADRKPGGDGPATDVVLSQTYEKSNCKVLLTSNTEVNAEGALIPERESRVK